MASDKLSIGPTFEKIILKEIINASPDFLVWVTHLKPDYFMSPMLGYFFHLILKSQKEQELIPTFRILRRLLKEDKNPTENRLASRLEALKEIKLLKYKDADRRFVLKRLSEFIKKQRYIAAINDGLPLLKTGTPESLKRMDELFKGILNQTEEVSTDTGVWYFRDIKNRLFRQFTASKHYKFLIPELDEHLRHGGMAKGETVMWLAPTGAGKTMALTYNAKAWMLQKLKGVYYTFQLMPQDITERFDASFSGVRISDIKDSLSQIQTKTEQLKARYGDSLVIKYFPRHKHSMASIRSHLKLLKDQGFDADFIVIDFLNYMTPENRSAGKDSNGSKYFEGGDIAGEFISFCQTNNLLGASGIQANRTGSKEDLTQIFHIAESFGSAMEATLVVTVNRNSAERASDRARLFIAKYSFGKDQLVIPIQTNYDKGSFYRRG